MSQGATVTAIAAFQPAIRSYDQVRQRWTMDIFEFSDVLVMKKQYNRDINSVRVQNERKPNMPDSLYERIGGADAVDAAVDLFYRKVLTDADVSHFFDTTDMDGQRAKQKSFLTMAFGGPHEYTGQDMRTAHAKLVEDGLNDSHFDKVAGHLQATLEELGVDAGAIGEVMAIAGSTRDDVLNR